MVSSQGGLVETDREMLDLEVLVSPFLAGLVTEAGVLDAADQRRRDDAAVETDQVRLERFDTGTFRAAAFALEDDDGAAAKPARFHRSLRLRRLLGRVLG